MGDITDCLDLTDDSLYDEEDKLVSEYFAYIRRVV